MIDAAALEHRLHGASALVHALLDATSIGAPLEPDEAALRRRAAFDQFDALALPSAVFEPSSTLPRLANLSWRVLFAAGDAATPALSAAIDQVAHSSAVRYIRELAVGGNGPPLWCAASVRPLRGRAGETTGAIVVLAMITDAVIARMYGVDEHALTLTGLVAAGPDYAGGAWCEYTGDADPSHWQRAIHADDVSRCREALAEVARQRVATDVEARVRRADGTYRWHRIAIAVSDLGARWLATASDIDAERGADAERTELLATAIAARADAEQATRLKDQFLATVSHELRTPVTTMLLWEQVLRDNAADDVVHARALQAIHESAVMQSRLVGDLLDISRGISGKLHIDVRSVDVARIARQAFATIEHGAHAKGVALVHRGIATAIVVEGDEGRLRQVFDNLLSNALKFTARGDTITLAVAHDADAITIDVVDTGRGIAPEFLLRVFEPFSQTDDALTGRDGGLGLGLAIARQLVELHHGTLVAASEGRGHGARLTLTLPASRHTHTPTEGISRTRRLDRVRILLVDDDPRVRDALSLLFDRVGARVSTAGSVAAAREQLAQHPADIVLCDIAMPGEDGYSFVRWLRASGRNTPTIALTAQARDADSARATDAGFDLHLAKPIDFERLVAHVDNLLGARRGPSEHPIT